MANSLGNQLSTGNKLIDAVGGGLFGLADATQSRGQYVPSFNWQGNGLARGGMQYMANPNYRNYGDAAQMTSSMFNGQKKDKEEDRDTFGSMGERLSTMLGKPMFGIDNSNPYGLNTKEFSLPQIGSIGGGAIGGQGYNPQLFSYGLPVQDLELGALFL